MSGRRLLKLLVELWRRPFASVARDYDAEHRIARPSTSPHLPPHLAALTRWSTLSRVCFDALAGVVCCVLMIWATGNIGLHHIHHLHPRIPNYRLQQALDEHAELRRVPTLTLWESFRCVRLTLWDERERKLVPFAAVRT